MDPDPDRAMVPEERFDQVGWTLVVVSDTEIKN